jgi:hypothetical protein
MSQLDDYMSRQVGGLDEEELDKVLEGIQTSVGEQPQNEPVEPQAEPTPEAASQQQQQPEPTPATAEQPTEEEEGQQDQSMPWQEGYDAGDAARTTAETVLSVPTALVDFGVDAINLIPGVEIPKIPEFNDRGLQTLREITSIVGPTVALTFFGNAAGTAASAKVTAAAQGTKGAKLLKHLSALGNDKFFQFFAKSGLAAGSGALVDTISEQQGEDPNAQATIRELLNTPENEHLFGIFPPDWATLDDDHPDVVRSKNRNEGIGIGLFSDVLLGAAKFLRARKGVKEATRWVPEDELATKYFDDNLDLDAVSDDPVEDAIFKSVIKRQEALDDLGRYNFTNNYDALNPTPQKGIHDMYGYEESGLRSADDLGVIDASVQLVRIQKNLDSSYGRLGSVMTDGTLKWATSDGENGFQVLRGLANELKKAGKYGYNTADGYISFKEIDDAGEALAADLYGKSVPELKRMLDAFKTDRLEGVSVLSGTGYRGVMKTIKQYMDDFANMDLMKAQAYVDTSFAGQVSDMAEGMRLMDGTAAIESAQEQILDRLAYLMVQKGQRSYVSGRALGILNMAKKAAGKLGTKGTQQTVEELREQTLKRFNKVTAETNEVLSSLRAVSKERPEMLGPLMLAYEMTDGNVRTIHHLNEWIRNSSGTLSKAFIDANPQMQSLVMQGVWANIYNSVLSAISTPLKAGASNAVLLVERPLATFVGALSQGDTATLRRGLYQYQAIGETFAQAGKYMGQVFRRASQNPDQVEWLYKSDFQRKNDESLELYKAFAESAEKNGDLGPMAMYQHIEAMNDLANHPVLKFGMNAMAAFDGFTNSVIANIEARGAAFDRVTLNGTKEFDEAGAQAIRKEVYGKMFDSTGKVTDEAVRHASSEIAMNMESPAIDTLGSLLSRAPGLKPFLMFPKTSLNVMRFTDTHSPFSMFVRDYNKIAYKPRHAFTELEIKEILQSKGIPVDEFANQRFDTLRAEIRGRKAIGTLAVLGAGTMFVNGRIRGSGHFDTQTNTVRREANWKPLTYMGNDGNWYSYENLGAITDWLSVTADVMDNFGSLDPQDLETTFNRLGFLLSAHLTNKSFMSGLEPLFDITSGNPAAGARWMASFGSSAIPLSGLRNEMARVMHPELRVVEQDVYHLIANRNPVAKGDLAVQYSWITGKKVNEPSNFFHRIWNAMSPWKVYGGQTELEKFLVDVEFDSRPSMMTNGRGVEYTPAQRAELYELMGKSGMFARDLTRIMNESKDFVKSYREAQASTGTYIDHRKWQSIHNRINVALMRARRAAEADMTDAAEVQMQQTRQQMIDEYTERGDTNLVNQVLGIYK